MEQQFADKIYEKIDFKLVSWATGEYESCVFRNCDLSECDLFATRFIDCDFTGCNLSLAKLRNASFQDVKFKDCKMLGLRFEQCDKFGFAVEFENCQLDHCSFYQVKLKKTVFKNSQIRESDFTESDLTEAVLDNCDLALSTFDNTILEKADFRTSYNYSINPEINRIKKAKFSLSGVKGLLEQYDIEIDNS